MTIQELVSQFARYRGKTNEVDVTQMCGLTFGSSGMKTTNDIIFFLYNQQIQFVAKDSITVTSCAIQAESSFCYYLVSIDINSSVTTTKGTDNGYALPDTPAGTVPIGAFRVVTSAGHTFTAGLTLLTATGITVTFYDIDAGIAIDLINKAQKNLEQGVTIVRNGRQRTIIDFNHMLVRASAVSLTQGDPSVILPFPNFKRFVDNGINITDPVGLSTPVEKEDTLPLGVSFQQRPIKISARIKAETVFTPDGYPGMEFDLWPICDQSYTLDIQAYQYSPYLDGIIYSRNWLTDNAPDILLFGALVESSLFFGIDAQSKAWEGRWQEAVWTLFASQQKEIYSGSPIYTRYPNPLGKRTGLGMSSNKAGIMSYGYIDT